MIKKNASRQKKKERKNASRQKKKEREEKKRLHSEALLVGHAVLLDDKKTTLQRLLLSSRAPLHRLCVPHGCRRLLSQRAHLPRERLSLYLFY
jgi:hypothetical protein